MKKSNLLKIILVGILSLMLVFVATQVFADDSDGFEELIISNTTNSDANNTTDTNTTNSTDANSTDTNTANTLNTTNTTNTLNTTNTANNTSNTSLSTYNNTTNNLSSYNNSNLPSTGLGETTSVVFIIAVLVISAVYAYKKVQDYKNI